LVCLVLGQKNSSQASFTQASRLLEVLVALPVFILTLPERVFLLMVI